MKKRVGDEHCLGIARLYSCGHVAGCVTRRHEERDLLGRPMVAGEQLQGAERLQRRNRLIDERERKVALNLVVMEGGPVSLVDEIACVRERELHILAVAANVAADMVGMKMAQDDNVDVVGPDARRSELVLKATSMPNTPAIGDPAGPIPVSNSSVSCAERTTKQRYHDRHTRMPRSPWNFVAAIL